MHLSLNKPSREERKSAAQIEGPENSAHELGQKNQTSLDMNAVSAIEPWQGKVLEGKYPLLELLGTGPRGPVFRTQLSGRTGSQSAAMDQSWSVAQSSGPAETSEGSLLWTLEEIGRRLSITRERVRQIEAKAVAKIRAARNHAA